MRFINKYARVRTNCVLRTCHESEKSSNHQIACNYTAEQSLYNHTSCLLTTLCLFSPPLGYATKLRGCTHSHIHKHVWSLIDPIYALQIQTPNIVWNNEFIFIGFLFNYVRRLSVFTSQLLSGRTKDSRWGNVAGS